MRLFRLIAISISYVIVLGIASGASSKVQTKKSLPLDKVSGVVLKNSENSTYLPGKIIVKLSSTIITTKSKTKFGLSAVDSYLQQYSVQSIDKMFPDDMTDRSGRKIDLSKFYVINYTSPHDAFSVAKELLQYEEIQYAEPWFVYSMNAITACSVNDPSRSVQWGLTNILADSAWCVSTGDTSIIIGIVDSGIQWNHADLAANIFINYGEYGSDGNGGFKQTNNIDDDGNGFIDDYHGWNFGGGTTSLIVPNNNPSPVISAGGHGTHVGGIASAVTNNSTGVAGIGYRCKLLPVKVTVDDDANQYIYFAMEGIVYAMMMGAKVINCSWGGPGAAQYEQEIIDTITAHGSLIVAAGGNTGNTVMQYPAGYRGVISVASTTTGDTKSSFSTYNEDVDVSAPGDNIYSTYYPNTYAYMSGTSMATPLVSGLAGLVASYYPSYTALQIGERVRVTADDISSLNPSYISKLGKGRINAYKALTQSSPSVREVSFTVNDSIGGNNNKILESGESAVLNIAIINYLSPTTSAAAMTLSSLDTNVQIISGGSVIGVLGTLQQTVIPYQIQIKSTAAQGDTAMLRLTMTDNGYSDYQYFSITLNPTYATHDVNNIELTLTSKGRIGFADISTFPGSGFIFNGANQLYEGGLIIGTSSTQLVDNIRNSSCGTCQDDDFAAQQIYNLQTPGTISAQDGNTVFTDALASTTNKIGLEISLSSYAYTTTVDSNYIILCYKIKNTSGASVGNLYAGLFFDWDIVGDQANYYAYNETAFDPELSTGYAWNYGTPNSVFCGARAFEGYVNYYALINSTSLAIDRASKWNWISSTHQSPDSVNDIHMVISSGPFTIENGSTKMIGFALLGGRTLLEFQEVAEAARVQWVAIKKRLGVDENASTIPTVFSLKQNYPNPFNPVTTIDYTVPQATNVSLKIFDILGRDILTLIDEHQKVGSYSEPFDASQLPSGVYFYKLTAGNFHDVKKMVLMK
jgi:serine protease